MFGLVGKYSPRREQNGSPPALSHPSRRPDVCAQHIAGAEVWSRHNDAFRPGGLNKGDLSPRSLGPESENKVLCYPIGSRGQSLLPPPASGLESPMTLGSGTCHCCVCLRPHWGSVPCLCPDVPLRRTPVIASGRPVIWVTTRESSSLQSQGSDFQRRAGPEVLGGKYLLTKTASQHTQVSMFSVPPNPG